MHYQPMEHTGDDAYVGSGGGAISRELNIDLHDDVWGADNADDSEPSHPSDMRRLETEHTTAGYREGIALGKEATLQKGFDEGYSMGAAIGLLAGQLLGTLEGVAQATKSQRGTAAEEAEKLLGEAREELSVAKLFSSEYWTPEALWSYEVPSGATEERSCHHEGALAHPLLRKWTAIVNEQVARWNIDQSVLDHLNAAVPEPQPEEAPTSGDLPARDPLDW